MDDDLSVNDPYRTMNTGEDEIRPEFLNRDRNAMAQNVLGAVEQVAAARAGGKAPAGNKGAAGMKGTSDGIGVADKNGKKENATTASGLYSDASSGAQKIASDDNKTRMPMSVKMAAPFVIVLLVVGGLIALVIGLPVMMIGAIDYNLQKALGFTNTVGILEEQAEYITGEMLSKGSVPSAYASDLALNGLAVGQILANGDFVRTDTYIANIDERNDLVAAASGFMYSSDDEGELALLYDGNIIKADDFVVAVESDPKLYAAYSAAVDISSKYYYSDDVSKVYGEMQLSRGNFNNWESTGNYKTDENNFTNILYSVLDGDNSDLILAGRHDDKEPYHETRHGIVYKLGIVPPNWPEYHENGQTGNFTDDVSEGAAEEITGEIAGDTKQYIFEWDYSDWEEEIKDKDGNPTGEKEWREDQNPRFTEDDGEESWRGATKRAAELLNTAVSAKEPYIASSAFIAVEEPIQRARIDGDGPVNQLMNVLSTPTSVTYQDVQTGEEVTKKKSILETTNFQAAVGERQYSMDEAANFSRDRVLQVTGQSDPNTIKSATVTSNGRADSRTVVRNGLGDSANSEVIAKANSSIDLAISRKNSGLFSSVVGANRILEGGSFLSNTINQKVLGAMPSDASAVAAYQTEVDKVLARKAEAERATLSPFDISSPNTFLGSIMYNLATTMMGVYGTGATSMLSTVRAAGNVTGEAVSGLISGTTRAEARDQHFTSLSPSNCDTIQTTLVVGDLYCTSHNTNSTDYMHYTMEDWNGTIVGDSIDYDGSILEGSTLEKFVLLGMDRPTTVGVKSADVCERYKEFDEGGITRFFNNVLEALGAYGACDDVDEGFATGAVYTRGPLGGVTEGEEEGETEIHCDESESSSGLLTLVGDSISNMAQDQIRALIPEMEVSAEDGRAMQKNYWGDPEAAALNILEEKAAKNDIGDFVVIEIGTNNFLDNNHPEYEVGWLKAEYFDEIKTLVGDKPVVLVTNFDLTSPSRFANNNAIIKEAAGKYGWGVADWAAIAASQNGLLTDADHEYGYYVHLTDKGKTVFAKMIYNALVSVGYKAGNCRGTGSDGEINVDLFTGYMLYNEVYNLLNGTQSSVAQVRDRYYAKHPLDDSEAGKIARISGMTKYEAEIALFYAGYLNEIANYDASDRYLFGGAVIEINRPILKYHSDEVAVNLYAWYQKEVEYRDVRNRQEMTA